MSKKLFILGFQKSGTTYLHNLLSLNKNVSSAHVKETYFFELDNETQSKYLDEYLRLFEPKSLMIESSVSYIHNRNALVSIKKTFPTAKCIVLVRDPLERTISAIKHTRLHGHGIIEDHRPIECFVPKTKLNILELLDWEKERFEIGLKDNQINLRHFNILERLKIGNDDSALFANQWHFNYFSNSESEYWLSEMNQIFDPLDVLIINFRSLKSDPLCVLNQVHKFLDISEYGYPSIDQAGQHSSYVYNQKMLSLLSIGRKIGLNKLVNTKARRFIKSKLSQRLISRDQLALIKKYYER